MEEAEAQVVEGEVVEPGDLEDVVEEAKVEAGLALREEPHAITLFGTTEPSEIVAKMTEVANHFHSVIDKQELTTRIGGGDHVQVEGWQTVGSMLGVFPVKDGEVREIPWPDPPPSLIQQEKAQGKAFGFVASYRAQTLLGHVVGGGEAECRRTESKWRKKEDHQLRSMAQTRAQSKALKAPLSFIVAMAGYNPTPAEEVEERDAREEGMKWGLPYDMGREAIEKWARASTFLTGDAKTAQELNDLMIADAGYLPKIAVRAVMHAARLVRDKQTELPHEEERQEDGSSDS